MGGKSDTQPAPDYTGAAKETAAGNLQNARITTKANRVNTYTPYGNLTFQNGQSFNQSAYDKALADYNASKNAGLPSYAKGGSPIGPDGSPMNAPKQEDFMTGDPDQWSAIVNLSPDQQKLLDQQNRTSQNLAGLQDAATGRVAQSMATPFNQSLLPSQPQVYDPNRDTNNAQQLLMNRLEPQFNRDQAALENKLVNQGLTQGSEAWNNALNQFGQSKNDAYNQAALQAIGLGQQQQNQQFNQSNQARQTGIQEQSYLRNLPLNELNALRTGAQVTNPTFQNFSQQQYTGGPNLLGAAENQYNSALQASNAKNAASGNFLGGLVGLGSLAMAGGGLGGLFGGGSGGFYGGF